MPSPRDQVAGKALEEVADFMARGNAGSLSDQIAKSEFALRQTLFQEDVAKAAKETADYTQRYTRYMFWSVVILAISAFGSLCISMLTYLNK